MIVEDVLLSNDFSHELLQVLPLLPPPQSVISHVARKVVSGKSIVPGIQGRETKPTQTACNTACTGRADIRSKRVQQIFWDTTSQVLRAVICWLPEKLAEFTFSLPVGVLWSTGPVQMGLSLAYALKVIVSFTFGSRLRMGTALPNLQRLCSIQLTSVRSTNNYIIFVLWISNALNHIICLFGKRKWSDFKWF